MKLLLVACCCCLFKFCCHCWKERKERKVDVIVHIALTIDRYLILFYVSPKRTLNCYESVSEHVQTINGKPLYLRTVPLVKENFNLWVHLYCLQLYAFNNFIYAFVKAWWVLDVFSPFVCLFVCLFLAYAKLCIRISKPKSTRFPKIPGCSQDIEFLSPGGYLGISVTGMCD